MLLYSTQWFSVIGHLFQTEPKPKWTLVDQNWYEFGEIPYEFRIDPKFGELYAGVCKDHGMQAATVDYHGFPIDTGTVVALKLLNPNNAMPASIVSCNIYAERDETRALGRAARAGDRTLRQEDDRRRRDESLQPLRSRRDRSGARSHLVVEG